jgi:hypothetical protein
MASNCTAEGDVGKRGASSERFDKGEGGNVMEDKLLPAIFGFLGAIDKYIFILL